MIEYALLGVAFGILAGLLPGLHPNTIAAFLVAGNFSWGPNTAAFLSALAASNAISSFLPSIFLGAPESESALSVLPGHKLLLDGKGYEAVGASCVGGLGAALLVVGMTPLLVPVLPLVSETIHLILGPLLLAVIGLLLFTEPPEKQLKSLAVLGLAGLFGVVAFQIPVNQETVLFPIFTGLFGLPGLLLVGKGSAPAQIIGREFGRMWDSVGGVVAGFVVGILPGVGGAEASTLVGRGSGKAILVKLGSVAMASALVSLFALILIGRARSGIAVALEQLVPGLGIVDLPTLLGAALLGTGLSAVATLFLAKRTGLWLSGRDLRPVSRIIAGCLVGATIFLAGPGGLFVLGVGLAIGFLPIVWGVRRGHAMGVLLIPTVLWAFGVV